MGGVRFAKLGFRALCHLRALVEISTSTVALATRTLVAELTIVITKQKDERSWKIGGSGLSDLYELPLAIRGSSLSYWCDIFYHIRIVASLKIWYECNKVYEGCCLVINPRRFQLATATKAVEHFKSWFDKDYYQEEIAIVQISFSFSK